MNNVRGMLAVLLLAAMPAGAQSSELLDRLLEEPQALYGDTVLLTLAAAGAVPDSATPAEAVETLARKGWKVAIKPVDGRVSLGEYAFLLMNSFGLHGGILYGLFPGPRYACRELGYLTLIPADARPLRSVSGEEVVRILGNVMAFKEAQP